MKIHRNVIVVLFFILISSFLFPSFSIYSDKYTDTNAEETSFSIAPSCLGNKEGILNCAYSSLGGNIVVFAKKNSQIGISHYHLFCNSSFKNLFSPNILLHKSSSKSIILLFATSWYRIFGLQKIIV
jgi:hypothetical protein